MPKTVSTPQFTIVSTITSDTVLGGCSTAGSAT